jgi:hypothetical protein
MSPKAQESAGHSPELAAIEQELDRLNADSVQVSMDDQFEPSVGELAKIEYDNAYWHLFPQRLLELLKELPDGAGGDSIKRVIEQKAETVWHGPEPEGSRDTK